MGNAATGRPAVAFIWIPSQFVAEVELSDAVRQEGYGRMARVFASNNLPKWKPSNQQTQKLSEMKITMKSQVPRGRRKSSPTLSTDLCRFTIPAGDWLDILRVFFAFRVFRRFLYPCRLYFFSV